MNTGDIIIILRKEKGSPQGDLAKKRGVSREMIDKYECGGIVVHRSGKKDRRRIGNFAGLTCWDDQ